MNQIRFTITCTRCGGPLTWINGARGSSLEAVAAMACGNCRRAFSVRVYMVDLDGERIAEVQERTRNLRTFHEFAPSDPQATRAKVDA